MLSSDIFHRAPTLAQLLAYICERYFRGEIELIKEYSIAVEALGRPAGFDQKRDSIVRVEAHRLRKRLREYYETEGKDHAIRIELPPGGYVPRFVQQRRDVDPSGGKGIEAAGSPADGSATRKRLSARTGRPVWWLAAAGSIVAVAALAGWLLLRVERPAAGPAPTSPAAVQADDLTSAARVGEIRIAAGSAVPVRDKDGEIWLSDRYFQGGEAKSRPDLEVAGTLTPELFRSWREGEFSYRIPLKPGVYELTLWFCEPRFPAGGGNSGSFRILLDGRPLVEEIDIIADVGAGQAVTARTFRDIRPGADGVLHLEFRPISSSALLAALSVVPGTSGRLRPIRIAAREEPYKDSEGHVWSSDRFFFGGRLVKRIEPIQGTEDPELYRGERYGRLTYTIPVPPDSTYTAVLHFAETWFGSRLGGGGEGSRLFDILCNGLLLERNLDVYKAAGGPFRAMRKTYRGLKPTPNGKLVFQLIPSRNYAFLNALEILDEGRAPAATPREK
ncbi:MAG: malectin [Bryobacteraceae bacterium]|nr:malectin [Bryobacteraceae bacterium]